MAAPTIARHQRWAPKVSAQIDGSHPLAVGLASYMVPTEGTRRIFDYATQIVRVQPAQFRTNVPAAGPFGMASHGDHDSVDELPTFNAALAATGALSTFSVFSRISGGNGSSSNNYVKVGSVSSANQVHIVNDNGSYVTNVSNWGNDITIATIAAGGWHTMGTTYGAAANEGYLDGLRVASSTAAAYAGNNQISTAFANYAYYALVAVWFRRLTGAEFAVLHNDPFCVLR